MFSRDVARLASRSDVRTRGEARRSEKEKQERGWGLNGTRPVSRSLFDSVPSSEARYVARRRSLLQKRLPLFTDECGAHSREKRTKLALKNARHTDV